MGINSLNVAGYQNLSLITQVVSGSGNAVDADWGNAQLTPPASTVLLSSVPITVGGNAIKVNTNFQGTPLMLGGIEYAQGIGVATDTKMVISTDGAYSTFTATIGVDSLVGVGGNVWFQILGDGKNLYFVQSITATSAPIPISINITGVQSLTLVTDYMGATNSSADDADWALAELHVAPPATPTVLVTRANHGQWKPDQGEYQRPGHRTHAWREHVLAGHWRCRRYDNGNQHQRRLLDVYGHDRGRQPGWRRRHRLVPGSRRWEEPLLCAINYSHLGTNFALDQYHGREVIVPGYRLVGISE